MNLFESDLNIEDIKRYSRQIVVPNIGIDGQKSISETKILIIGLGGLGSPVLMYLAMAGFKKIGVADFDKVELHNLQRQSIHSESTIGEYKTKSAIKFISKLNSKIDIEEYCQYIDETNINIIKNYDIIIDCSDQISLRYIINDACRYYKKDLISASVLRWEGQIYVIPKNGYCFRCMFPSMKLTAGTCDTSGVVGAMCGVIGAMQATEVIKLVLEIMENKKNETKLIIFNGSTTKMHCFKKAYKSCKVCNGLKDKCEGFPEFIKGLEIAYKNDCKYEINKKTTHFQKEWKDIIDGNYYIVDIRKEIHFRMFRVKGSVNIEEFDRMVESIKKQELPVVVSCYRGIGSVSVVEELRKAGIEAYSAVGGIESFKNFVNFDKLE